jgi:predicted metal-dependent hydrolase
MSAPDVAAHTLSLGGSNELAYSVRRTGRRRTVGIIVEPDGHVAVLAPTSATPKRIEQILRRHLTWIRRQRRAVEALPPPPLPREWVNGETHRYLGRQYRLKIVRGHEPSVKLLGRYFVVATSETADRSEVQTLMETWYRRHARVVLATRVQALLSRTTWLDVESPPMRVRVLRDRWGSTSPSGRVSFNVELVKLPLSCVDYVVAHELVHLMIPNHSSAYWRMVERVMPDWRRWRQRLATIEL